MLARDPVARASYARLQRQGTDVKFVNDLNMREMGLFDPYSNEVTVNMLRHSSVREAGSTVVHEALHQNRFFRSGVAPGTQFEEYLAFRNEFLFQNARRPTLMERQQIINDVVKPLYPHLPSGKLPTFGGGETMKPINVKGGEVSAVQALRFFEGGQHLSCPVCDALLDSIPAGIAPGTGHISGLVCPVSNKHYLIYGEDADVMKKAREGLRRIAGKLE
jgi:hypothetical protein